MSSRIAVLLGALCLSFFGVAIPVSAEDKVALSEYGKLPEVEFTALSPSGDRIALIATIKGKRVLLALEEQTKPLRVVAVGDLKIRGIDWIGEERILITTSATVDLPFGFTTDKAEFSSGRVVALSDNDESGVIFGNKAKYFDAIMGSYGIRKINGTYYGFFGGLEFVRDTGGTQRAGNYRFDHGRPHLFKVNLENFDIKKVSAAAAQGYTRDWLVDAQGKVAYSLDVNETTGTWIIRNANNKKIIDGKQARGAVSLIGIGIDGTSAVYVERGETRSYWYEIGQEGGEPRPFLDDTGFEGLFWNRETGSLMGYTIGEDEFEQHIFADKELQKKANRVRKAFTKFESRMADWTSDLSDVIVRVSGNGDSGSYFAVDLGTNRANVIAYERTAIGPEVVGDIKTFEYTASDGMEMDGILTLPPGREAKNLPVVLLPHGGPHYHNTPAFDWWAQAFASRGYAVFQPNFRGSTNRTASFKRAGYGEWGRKMQTDKSDGLKALADAGIVDPSRACIVGASYGGYAALAGVTIQQGLYKCAVAVAPVSDLANMYREDYRASGKDRTTKVALLEQLGDRRLWADVSPLKKAELADAPIMLIHGKDDTVVPYSHSTRMADKLKDAQKTYELVTLDGEDHWLSLSVTRQKMLENAVRWVETYNPAD